MDFLSLIDEIKSKEKILSEDHEKKVFIGKNSENVKITEEDFLSDLEISGLICILNEFSLQLHVLHAGMSGNFLQNTASIRKLNKIVYKTNLELSNCGTFQYLSKTVEEECRKRKDNEDLEKKIAENERKIHQLKFEIRSNDKIKEKDLNKKQQVIGSLKDEIQNLIAKSESKIRYISRWESARQGDNQMRNDNAEMKLKIELDDLNNLCNEEIRVNDKICTFLHIQTEDFQKTLDDWTEIYHAEMKLRKEKIKRLQDRTRELEFRIRELKELFKDRQKEIGQYLKFKDLKREEEARNQFICNAATKIQAWWRGTMVRRGLGPYKKRKKAGKEKKKKDK